MEASSIISQMFNNDRFSQWLGIERLEERAGYCKLKMVIRAEMCNGFGLAHGGITYSFADSTLAFASNSRGRHALSIETSISHLKPLFAGDIITATSKEVSVSKKLAVYIVSVAKETGELVAIFKGTVYVKDKEWK
jgi:acyl-CoA thioesterase